MITRIILAAGAGTRMGTSKPLLRLGDMTALERIVSLEMTGVENETIIVTGHQEEEVSSEALRLGITCVHNPRWETGRTSSVKCGLATVTEETLAVMVHPVDMPLVRQCDYDACIQAWKDQDSSDTVIVASHTMRRGHPVILGHDHLDAVRNLGDDEPLHLVVRQAEDSIVHVAVDNPWVVQDLNTPEDHEAALKWLETGQ